MMAGTVPAVQLPEAKIENNLVEAAHSQRGGTVSAKVLEALHTKAASIANPQLQTVTTGLSTVMKTDEPFQAKTNKAPASSSNQLNHSMRESLWRSSDLTRATVNLGISQRNMFPPPLGVHPSERHSPQRHPSPARHISPIPSMVGRPPLFVGPNLGPPTASVGVDVDGDGQVDVVVSGLDRNHDGIPDALQVPHSPLTFRGPNFRL